MKEIGIYKTNDYQDFSIHFDAEKQLAIARGPLPNLKEAAKVNADSEEEAVEKIGEELGQGVLAEPSRTKLARIRSNFLRMQIFFENQAIRYRAACFH